MSFLPRIFRSFDRNFSALRAQNVAMYEYRIANGDKIFTAHPPLPETPPAGVDPVLGKAFFDAISMLPNFTFTDPGVDLEMRARTDVFMALASLLGYTPMAGNNGSIYLHNALSADSQQSMAANLRTVAELFAQTFGESARPELRPVSQDVWGSALAARIARAKDYFLVRHGDWINTFTENLSDDHSRDSLATYLRQRVLADIYYDCPIAYPVAPPMKSAAWRKERESLQYNFPVLKGLRYETTFQHIFIYEQYGIAGAVEATPGQTVIDAGAFIGDTACYFSRKVGGGGKVYAFEATPDSARLAKENMQANGCDNVEIVPFALSDQKQTLHLNVNSAAASSNRVLGTQATDADGNEQAAIEAIRLDDFVAERGIQVDFIKADIEGAEMAMLNGAANTIARDAPTCALCVYHKQDDFWTIPEFLRAQVKDYRFWFRCEAEPVVFAKRG